jgi:benzoyl-CoA reductase/2-hydroxyglutaryl-CoA dehydratase subunit BcrC/BadD/HgdB
MTEEVLELSYEELVENPEQRLREFSASEETILGYVYPHAPLELLLAHGITPSLVRANPSVRGGFEASLQTFSCSLTRNLFSQRSNGRLLSLSGLLFPSNTCDSLHNVADVWRRRFPEDKIFRLTYPAAKFDEDSVDFLAEELRILSESLKTALGCPFSIDGLLTAVSLVNNFRNAAQTLYSCRVVDPGLVSYSEVTRMVREFLTTPNVNTVRQISESARVASQILDARRQLSAAKLLQKGLLSGAVGDIEITVESKTPRVMVVGGMIEPQAIASLFKASTKFRDNLVVLDLLSYGFKTVFTPAMNLEGDHFVAMARSILGAPSEPTQEGLPGRIKFLKHLLSRLIIRGLVVCEQSFCEPDQFEAPSLVNAASEVGVPSVRLPMDPELSDRARLEGRIQSFLETLEGGPK